jgi:hypothetical protein
MTGRRATLALALILTLVALAATACGSKDVNAQSDSVACVYDGSKDGGHRFKRMVLPGQHLTVGRNDVVVRIPTSARFYNMTSTDSRDTLAPTHLLAQARGQTGTFIEGVLQFKFDIRGNKPCEWYSKHGRRNVPNGDESVSDPLGFNARGQANQANAGWFHILAEKFAVAAQQTAKDASAGYTWSQLVYGSDPTVKRERGAESITLAYGKHFGEVFTKYLNFNLGGEYFCGSQEDTTESGCPPIYFQLTDAYPQDKTLTVSHNQVQQAQAKIEAQKQQAALNAANRAQLIADAKAQKRVLELQNQTAALTARNDADFQKCKALAELKLDCDGHFQTVIVAGAPKQ